jgi:hypothetical protein
MLKRPIQRVLIKETLDVLGNMERAFPVFSHNFLYMGCVVKGGC